MKLTQLAAKPQLIKITLDKPELVAKYGEPLEFYIHDRQTLDQFVKMATTGADNYGEMITMVNTLVLDETGAAMLNDDNVLPNDVMIAVIGAVVERLGK